LIISLGLAFGFSTGLGSTILTGGAFYFGGSTTFGGANFSYSCLGCYFGSLTGFTAEGLIISNFFTGVSSSTSGTFSFSFSLILSLSFFFLFFFLRRLGASYSEVFVSVRSKSLV
jgi:hypothetical protein